MGQGHHTKAAPLQAQRRLSHECEPRNPAFDVFARDHLSCIHLSMNASRTREGAAMTK